MYFLFNPEKKMLSNQFVKKLLLTVLIYLLINIPLIRTFAQENRVKDVKYYLSNLPFSAPDIKAPEFPDRQINIQNFGAIGDGITLNTNAFAKAINECSNSGGGTVIVPPGIWLTGPIKLESNVNLHLEKGALILLSKNHEDYPIILLEGSTRYSVASPVYGFNLKNIAITGPGIIDGSGETWRPVKKSKLTESEWNKLVSSGGVLSDEGQVWWPSKSALDGAEYLKNLNSKKPTAEELLPARDYLRPYMVLLVNCKNVLLDGTTFENSPKFVLYPNKCDNLIIRNVKVLNEYWAQNGDGIDISACKNVLLYNNLVNAGDDGICMKSSGKSKDGQANLENIIIRDCVVYHAHGGFVIGSNTDGGMNNIYVDNCNFIGTDIGLRFKSGRNNGGLVHNIFISNIYMKDIIHEAILFTTFYADTPVGGVNLSAEANNKTPIFKDFHISNIFCDGAEQAVKVAGLPEMPIQDIELTNVTINSKKGFTSNEAENFKLNNVRIFPEKGVIYSLKNSSGFSLNNVECPKGTDVFMKLEGEKTKDIHITNSNLSNAKEKFEFGNNVKPDVVLQN
jgi:DNA sulfur modification protein DndE